MNPRVRRAAIVALLAIAVAGAAAAAWYVMGEARRTGRLVARLLSTRLGVPVTVDAAVVEGSRLRLRGVALSPAAGATVVLRAERIDVAGGMLALLAPAGRRLSIVIVSPSVSVHAAAAPGTGTALDALPGVLRGILDWPGDLLLSVEDAAVRVGEHAYRASTTANKTGSVATAVVRLVPSQQSGTLTAEIRGEAADGGAVRLHAEVTGDPSHLSGLWPVALPGPATLTARVESRFAAGEPVTATGRLTIGTTNAAPVVVDFASSYDARQPRLTVSRYAAVREPDVRLEGEADIGPSESGLQLAGTARGELEGSRLNGRAAWESGRFEGEVSVATLDIDRVARRLRLGPAPASARRVTARFSGVGKGPRSEATLQARAEQVMVPALPGAVLGATLDARLGLAAGTDVGRLARVHGATLTVRRGHRTLALVTAASPSSGLWPLALEAKTEDLSQLVSVLPTVARLSGQGRFAGEIRESGHLALRGVVEVTVPEAEVDLGRPVMVSNFRASIPVLLGAAPSSAPGTLTLARVAGGGIIVTDLTGAAELVDGRLLLRDLRYAQAGGRGSGWLEAILGVGAPRLRARLDAERVDLATLLNETGLPIGRLTGRLRYTLTAQHPASAGYVALLRASSEEGGEVSIDAIQRLLESAAVQAETSGVLHQTLENLRVFPYESLTAEVRISAREARLDLSLVGRKRLGIFPAPVEAINLRNVPLALLARTFARGSP